jgi:hypothetical protein
MSTYPTFFFSHAGGDRELPGRYLIRFFEDLEKVLASWAGVSLDDRRLGTIDKRIEQGRDWDRSLSTSLSDDVAFIAVYTPLYFNRENCGKELGVFLLRIPNLGIDTNGALTRVTNVIPIRWMAQEAYAANTVKDSLIPRILRLIEDTPADPGYDEDRARAIDRYRKKGMSACVGTGRHYNELLDLFAQAIRELKPLPAAANPSFAGAFDAFRYDWADHFATSGQRAEQAFATAVAPPIEPRALNSVVAFYLTRRALTFDAAVVSFADKLIAEPLNGTENLIDAEFADFLKDVRNAAVAENMTIFHAAPHDFSFIPATLEAKLIKLTQAHVLTVLVIDSELFLRSEIDQQISATTSICRSKEWVGMILVPFFNATSVKIKAIVQEVGMRADKSLLALPAESNERVSLMRRAFLDIRGRLLSRNDGPNSPDGFPLLKGVGGERK